jgi:glycosyltransferase involved in cell wall biosynthesis
MSEAPLTVCMFGTYEAGYDRNQVLMRGLREAGVDVYECHVPVWETMRYKTSALKGPLQYVGIFAKLTLAYAQLCLRYLRAPGHDIVFVGYLGHFDVLPARLLSWLRRKPLVFDAFVSLYDTAVEDRALFPKKSLIGRLLRTVDRWSCKLSDLVLLDTNQHIAYFRDELGLSHTDFQRVLVGAAPAYIADEPAAPRSDPFVVLHYGKFAPLHGMNFILNAANQLRSERDIVFKIVGRGQTFSESKAYAERLGLDNLELIPWLEPEDLRRAIGEAHVCLGIFGETQKASRVVPNKVYQCLAAGAAVVTGRSPASEELLSHGEHALLCEMASGEAIASAILELRANPPLRRRLGENGARLFRERFTPRAVVEAELLPRLRGLLPS